MGTLSWSVNPVENAETRCAARPRADRRKHWDFGRWLGGARRLESRQASAANRSGPRTICAPPLRRTRSLPVIPTQTTLACQAGSSNSRPSCTGSATRPGAQGQQTVGRLGACAPRLLQPVELVIAQPAIEHAPLYDTGHCPPASWGSCGAGWCWRSRSRSIGAAMAQRRRGRCSR